MLSSDNFYEEYKRRVFIPHEPAVPLSAKTSEKSDCSRLLQSEIIISNN